MLFMVIERFKNGDFRAVGARFREKGRMMPDHVTYHASWLESSGACCFQIMEAPGSESLNGWIQQWHDLVDFEIIPIQTSQEFWRQRAAADLA